mmetsp:Transcript_7445/g.20703  ORF Transcript_7445/g.20703 Transcript_7445/m.20703 type:complete len:941 (-) Transcript_7445:2571-5393(-)
MVGGGRKKRRTKWSRKRKVEEKERKSKGQERWKAKRGDREYKSMIQSNPRMEAYYALQGLHNSRMVTSEDGTSSFVPCVTEAEKEVERLKWISTLKTILPASFRLGTDLGEELRDRLEKDLDEFTGKEIEIEIEIDAENRRGWVDPDASCADVSSTSGEAAKDADAASEKDGGDGDEKNDATNGKGQPKTRTKKVAPANRIEYIPHGYQLSVDRRTVKRNSALAGLHEWLKVQTAAGFLTRQETVSMIPPVVLAPEPGHAVLDMCAAPGSKTSQLLEVVSQMPDENMLEPRGFVVANDADPKRAYMLVHQLRRINSPAVFVTSIEAQVFPNLLKAEAVANAGEEGMFDRVLCDVPCSGDGTTRKNPGMWRQWNQLGALALHPLQLRIALNGCRLTRVGGYMCYSTCSMNPVENEAVVAEILREANGAVELVEKRSDMPGLRARPGWTSWKVLREDRTNSQSRKQRENKKKKNNAKMQQRRKEWEEKRKQQEQGGGEGGAEGAERAAEESKNGEEEDNKVGGEDVEMAEAGDKGTEKTSTESNDKDSEDRPAPREFTPPESWDDDTLEGLAKSAGLVIHENFDSVPDEWKKRLRSTVFPPTAEEASRMNLERCMRCLPQDMDTGGFFVALFKKVAPMRPRLRKTDTADGAEDESTDQVDTESKGPETKKRKVDDETGATPVETGDESTNSGKNGADNKQGNGKGGKQGGRQRDLGNSPFIKPNADKFPPLVEHYGLTDSFPQDQIMVRSNGEAKMMYFMSGTIKKELIDRGLQDKVMPINSGLKAFERNTKRECEVDYRVTQEGIHFIAPHMTKRVVVADPEDFVRCLGPGGIRLSQFSADFAEAVRALSMGSFVVALRGYERNVSQKMFIVMWRCRGDAMNCLVSKAELDGMFSKLRGKGVDIPLTSGDGDNDKDEEVDGNGEKAQEGPERDKVDEEPKE